MVSTAETGHLKEHFGALLRLPSPRSNRGRRPRPSRCPSVLLWLRRLLVLAWTLMLVVMPLRLPLWRLVAHVDGPRASRLLVEGTGFLRRGAP